jgi:hypothetical protein
LIFTSPEQEKLFEGVVSELRGLGYDRPLLRKRYKFQDWFAEDCSPRTASLVAFGRQPIAYDTACFVVLTANGKSGHQLVADHRAVGAPLALEVRDNSVVCWRVSNTPSETDKRFEIPAKTLSRAFREHKAEWRPESILRAKNISRSDPRQLDFIDAGLIPALEKNLRDKLDPLLRDALSDIKKVYGQKVGHAVDPRELFRLAFWMLAGKILHDRGVEKFCELELGSAPNVILDCVRHHYREAAPKIRDEDVLACARDQLWGRIDFSNLSGDVLAHIYENTLVTPALRREQGIHATPPEVADYVVRHLPIPDFPRGERCIVEPCCGHATFLVAALKRLRELLPRTWSNLQRHEYLKNRLWGFEKDPFALEVARLTLTLADLPNPNGWNLNQADVFRSRKLSDVLPRASAVLCNPPFEDFDPAERPDRPRLSVHKPVALVEMSLRYLHPRGVLGLVLPRTALDGHGYRGIRAALAERFGQIELVSLPDKAFEHSDQETVLLLAACPDRRPTVHIIHHRVDDPDWLAFKNLRATSREDREKKSVDSAADNLGVLELREIWEYLGQYPRLGDAVSEMHRGIEWNLRIRGKEPDKQMLYAQNREKVISQQPRPGFQEGLLDAIGLHAFQVPPSVYLRADDEYRRGNAIDYPWGQTKVLVSSGRISRGPWRIAAFADERGLIASQAFFALWPKGNWTAKVLAAVLNGPLANAYITAHEATNRRIRLRTMKQIPLPELSETERREIVLLEDAYRRAVASDIICAGNNQPAAILREIDAVVLKAYNLPPSLEHHLLDYFQGEGERRPTPFDFGDYFPPDFESYVPLHLYLSDEYQRSTAASVRAAFKRLPRRDSIRRALEVAVEAFEE